MLAGATAYLLWLTQHRHRFSADPASAALLDQINDEGAEQLAAGILHHYSQEPRFWNLVHHGQAERIDIRSRNNELSLRYIDMPSIQTHLHHALMPGSQRTILIRDLVMSTVGCGIAYGLIGGDAMLPILQTRSYNIRFFLCSPLTVLPTERTDKDDREHYLLTPLEVREKFPRLDERSAALTQLLLASLSKARPHRPSQ